MGDAELLDEAKDELIRVRDRLGSWKNLAKRYRERLGLFMLNPSLLLGMLTLQAGADEKVMAYRAAECLGWVFEGLLRRTPQAKNYIEITLTGADGRNLYVTLQRPGGKTPAQLYSEAKAELEQRRSLDGMRKCLKDGCDTWYRPGVLSDGGPRYCPNHNDLNP